MVTFENPANGYREHVPAVAWLWALLFGWFYLAVRGLWLMIGVQLALIVLASLAGGGPGGLLAAIVCWLFSAAAVLPVLKRRYLRMGWRQL
jgi:hypothetical protein